MTPAVIYGAILALALAVSAVWWFRRRNSTEPTTAQSKTTTPPIDAHPFNSDRPIRSAEDDRLGRSNFAQSVAHAVAGWTGRDSLVVALYGSWGSGKTSIKNMLVESLRSRSDTSSQVTVVEFNPWTWTGQDQVASAFFNQIGIHLGRGTPEKSAKKLATKWKLYAAYLKVGSSLFDGLKGGATGLQGLLGATGVISKLLPVILVFLGLLIANGFPATLPPYVRLAVSAIALVLGGVAWLFNWGAKVAEAIAGASSAWAESNQKDLQEIKTELAGLLRNLGAPILVVIDDIDRLPPSEIRLLVQLVKANADLPNIVYLVLFQRDIVEKALDIPNVTSGRDYLEKIIQVGFDVPRVEQPRVERILFAELDKLLTEGTAGQLFDQHRWGNLYLGGLRTYFGNLRDVHRFVNTVSFQFSVFRGAGSFEVNPVDLIALEVLRVFEPDAYHSIAVNKETLTSTLEPRYNPGAKETVNSIIHLVQEERRERVRQLVKMLFPTIEWTLGGSSYGSSRQGEWYRSLRVCHPDVFDRYFLLATPEGDISNEQLQRVLALVGDRHALIAELRRYETANLLGILLNRLEAYKEHLSLSAAEPFLTALFDIGDNLPSGSFLSGFGPDIHATRIVHWYLKQEPDDEKRAEILSKAMSASTGLYLPVKQTTQEDSKAERESGQTELFLVNEQGLQLLKTICVEKIKRAAMNGGLAGQKHLDTILYRWREWASEEEPQMWVTNLINTRNGLLTFLKAFIETSYSAGMGDHVRKVHRRINLNAVEDFVTVDIVASQVQRLDLMTLTEDEGVAVIAFNKAVRRRAEGKPDSRWHFDDDE